MAIEVLGKGTVSLELVMVVVVMMVISCVVALRVKVWEEKSNTFLFPFPPGCVGEWEAGESERVNQQVSGWLGGGGGGCWQSCVLYILVRLVPRKV